MDCNDSGFRRLGVRVINFDVSCQGSVFSRKADAKNPYGFLLKR